MTLAPGIALAAALAAAGLPALAEDDPASLMAEGRYADAVGAARGRASGASSSGHDWHLLGDALAATGKAAEAADAYRRALAGDGAHPLRIEVALSRLLLLGGDDAEARDRLRRVLAAATSDDLSAAELSAAAAAARLLGGEDPALYRRAVSLYERAIARSDGDPAARTALADLLLEKYNNTEARALYQEVLAADAGYVPALLGLARSQYFDHSRAAMATARRALALQPGLVAARVLVARILTEMEHYAEADEELQRALDVNPASPEALTLRMMLRFLRGDEAGYEALSGRLDALAPGYRERYAMSAEIAAQNRLYADAVRFAREGVARHPTFWRAHGLLGVNRLRLGQVDAGRRHLEAAFRGDPFNVWIKNTLDLLDRVDEFTTVRRGRFVLVTAAREAGVLPPLLFPLAEAAYDAFAVRYGHEPRTPVRIEVYPRPEDFSVRTVGLVGVDILGVSFGPTVAMISPGSSPSGTVNWGSVLWHELAHTFHLSMSGSRVPRWFTEGLSVLEERRARPGWGADVTPGFLEAYRQGRMPPASGLNAAFTRPAYPEQVGHAYFQASLVLEYMESNYGVDTVRAMLDGFGRGMTGNEVIGAELGLAPEAFDQAFDAYVRARFPEAPPGPSMVSLWRTGAAALDAGDLDAAEADLREAQRRLPAFESAGSPRHLLARVHHRRGDLAAAIEAMAGVVDTDADDLEAHRELAALYVEAGRPVAAAGVMERSLYIDPFDAALRNRLASIYEDAGDWQSALPERAAVAGMAALDPAGAHYRHARALARSARYLEARREVLRALELAPLYDDALELLLEVRAALNDGMFPLGPAAHDGAAGEAGGTRF